LAKRLGSGELWRETPEINPDWEALPSIDSVAKRIMDPQKRATSGRGFDQSSSTNEHSNQVPLER
jgi:hypothetical protein